MNELDMSDLTGFDWAGLWETVRTVGLDFGMKAFIALVIFYVGRTIARLVTRLYEPQGGSVRVDDIATWDARVADIRTREVNLSA